MEAATDVAEKTKNIAEMAHLMTALRDLAQQVSKIQSGMAKNKMLHDYFLTMTAIDMNNIKS